MDKKDLFDALDDFSQTLLVTLAEVEAVKKNLKSVVEENIALHLENDKLRERLGEWRKKLQPRPRKTGIICVSFIMTAFMFVRISMVSAGRMTRSVCSAMNCYLGSSDAGSKKVLRAKLPTAIFIWSRLLSVIWMI